jgi:hypothetical protein
LRDVGLGSAELAGSYCIKAGTAYQSFDFAPDAPCDINKHNCDDGG